MEVAMSSGTLTGTLIRHRRRLGEIAGILTRNGLAAWVPRGAGLLDAGVLKKLHEQTAGPDVAELSEGERLRRTLTELGTTWVKFGQMLSLRPDVVGADVAAELEQLRASVPADPAGVARRTVEKELGKDVDDLYASFDDEPFASGSVAQVHRATLADGTPVAVKVVHDGAAQRVREDLELMAGLAAYFEANDPELAQLRPTILVDEFTRMMEGAIDLHEELDNLQRFNANFAGEPDVVIPVPYPDRSSAGVLTMSMITGAPFTDRASVEATGWDVDTLVRRSADIYVEMIFRDGLYHADPHPGNFLVPDDAHLAILDFGDVGRVSSTRRLQLENLVIAIGTRDVDELVDGVIDMTTPPPGIDMRQLRADIEMWLNRYLLVGVGQLDMAAIVASGMELLRRHQLVLPADLALLFRVLLRLQGLGRGVGTEVRVTELVQPYVSKMLADRFDPRRIARHVGRSVREWEHLVARLPDDLGAMLEQLRTGKLGVDLRVRDPDHAVDHLVDGLVTGASVLAGAQLVSRRAGPLVAGLSVPGLVAAAVGIVTWQRLIARRETSRSWVTRARELARSAGPVGRRSTQ
jgi:ubiquinone biosynthesis protein